MIAKFRRQHDTMVGLADQLLAAVATRSSERFAVVRLAFSRAIIEHCREEGAAVRDAVSKGLIASDIAARSARTVMLWRADLTSCNSAWPAARVFAAPNEFLAQFKPLIDALKREVHWEEQILLTAMERNTRTAIARAA